MPVVDNPSVVSYSRFMDLAKSCGDMDARITVLNMKIQELREAFEYHLEYGGHDN